MSTPSFIANVNTLVKNINAINSLAVSLDAANVKILQQLLDEVNLVPIIEDLEKGSYEGNRQIVVNLLENYVGYSKELSKEELEELYLNVAIKPEYRAVRLNLSDNTSATINFVQDGIPYNISTNVELYEFMLRNSSVSNVLQNTLFLMTPEVVVSTELTIVDVANSLSNLISLDLISADAKGQETDPNFNWVDHTSSLQLLAQYFSAIQFLAYNIDDILQTPEEVEKIYNDIRNLSIDLENIINRIVLQTANPDEANVGDVLTIEVIDGVKVARYKPIADVGGFKMVPATKTTLGGIIAGAGCDIDAEGLLNLDTSQLLEALNNHNINSSAHDNLAYPKASTLVAGITKLSNSTVTSDSTVAASLTAVKTVNDIFSTTMSPNKAPKALSDGTFDKSWKIGNEVTQTINPDSAQASTEKVPSEKAVVLAIQAIPEPEYKDTVIDYYPKTAAEKAIAGSTSWRKWKSGLIEQWFSHSSTGEGFETINYPTPFTNVNSIVGVVSFSGLSAISGAFGASYLQMGSKTTTNFLTYGSTTDPVKTKDFYVKGY